MNRPLRFFAALAAAALALATPDARGHSTEPPPDMIKLSPFIATSSKGVKTDLKRSWYDWNTLDKKVEVKRRERQLGSAWSEQVQEIATQYFPVDVRWRCDGATEIGELYVAGVYENGDAVVEKWTFTYPPSTVGSPRPDSQVGVRYVPLDQRPLPTMTPVELYRGTAIGRIRTLEPDPEGRFLLLLSREKPTLYRIRFLGSAVSPPTVELSQATMPYLASCGVVDVSQHESEGRQYHVYPGHRWHPDLSTARSTIVLRDRDNDGIFDPPELVSSQQWTRYGYDSYTAWTPLCGFTAH